MLFASAVSRESAHFARLVAVRGCEERIGLLWKVVPCCPFSLGWCKFCEDKEVPTSAERQTFFEFRCFKIGVVCGVVVVWWSCGGSSMKGF